jgi:hypothetical protein
MEIGIGLLNQVHNVRPETVPQWAAKAEEPTSPRSAPSAVMPSRV